MTEEFRPRRSQAERLCCPLLLPLSSLSCSGEWRRGRAADDYDDDDDDTCTGTSAEHRRRRVGHGANATACLASKPGAEQNETTTTKGTQRHQEQFRCDWAIPQLPQSQLLRLRCSTSSSSSSSTFTTQSRKLPRPASVRLYARPRRRSQVRDPQQHTIPSEGYKSELRAKGQASHCGTRLVRVTDNGRAQLARTKMLERDLVASLLSAQMADPILWRTFICEGVYLNVVRNRMELCLTPSQSPRSMRALVWTGVRARRA